MTDPARRQSDPRIDKLATDVEKNKRDTERLLVVVEGIPDYNANGEVIGYIGGMRNDITDLKHQGNGGGGFSLRAKDKAQIGAIIGFIAIVLEGIRSL